MDGETTSPRGMKTKEILAFQSSIAMTWPVIQNEVRNLGYKFMAAEAAWILSGDNRVSTIKAFSKDIEKFSDDSVTFFGAYGPRVIDQLAYIAKTLANDQDTRQAILTIWRQNPGQTKDVPCTISVQWFIREGRIHCIDTMRSSDLWLGWPYDICNFTMLTGMIMLRLRNVYNIKLKLGDLTLQAGSQHLYEKNWEAAKEAILDKSKEGPYFDPYKFEDEDEFVSYLWRIARNGNGMLDI
jgi:thymidylate synthase